MFELIAALVVIPVVFAVAMMLLSLVGIATYAPFILLDRLLERVWGVRHPEPTVVFMPPAPPMYQAPMPPPVIHNHHYYISQPPAAPSLPMPAAPPAPIEGEWRVVGQPVQGSDEVRRLLATGRQARRLPRGD